MATVSTESPSWPGLAVVTKKPKGQVDAQLRAVESGHRAGHGLERIFLSTVFRGRIGVGGRTVQSRQGPPPDTARGMWLALDHLHPGLVRHFGAEGLVIGAPGCGAWVTVRSDGADGWSVTAAGPRDIWGEIQGTAARWRAAGEPGAYRLHFGPGGEQRVSAGHGPSALSWQLPALPPVDERVLR